MHKNTSALLWLVLAGAGLAPAQQAHVNLDWNPQKNTQNLTPYGANVLSPEVRDDHTITFRMKAPEVQRVELTGGPILLALGLGNKPVPFKKGEDGILDLDRGAGEAEHVHLQIRDRRRHRP